jgi:predicted porin
MKRTLLVAAVSTLAASAAMAQSSVTIYGRMNTSGERQKYFDGTGSSKSVLANNGSRIGFKGLEDLGGGLKAGFTLEHRLNSDDGRATNAAFWGGAGESSVYLMGDSWGMVKAGHYTSEAYFATSDVTDLLNHGTGTSADQLYKYLGSDNNKVSYRTPALGPVTAEVGYIFGEGTAPKSYDLAINATFGAFGVGLGAEKVDDNVASALSGDTQVGLRVSYSASPLTVTGYVQRYKSDSADASKTIGRVSAQYDIGALELHAAFGLATKLTDKSLAAPAEDEAKAKQYTLGVNYNLSKRTKVYTYYTKVAVSETEVDPSAFAIGIRHNF